MFVSIAWCFGRILGSARLSILWILLAEWRALMYILYVQAAHVRVAIWMLWLLSQDRQSYNSNANTCISVGRVTRMESCRHHATVLHLKVSPPPSCRCRSFVTVPIRAPQSRVIYRLNSLASIVVVLFSCRKLLVLVCSLGRGILRECRIVVVHHLGIPKATIDRKVR